MVDILVLGATGVTGRQVTRYLNSHPQHSQFTLAIAGRSRRKLDNLISDLSLPKSIQIQVVDVTNFEQVEALVKDAKIVLNTVGPYTKWGSPVVRACARNGVHYVDLTGEQIFVRDIIEKYDYVATKTGSILVPSCGMDSLPSDIAVHIANKALKQLSKDAVEPLQIDTSTTSHELHGVFSNGTISTILTAFGSTPKHKLAESLRDYYLSPVEGKPSPPPRLKYSMSLPSTREAVVGGYFMMSSANRAIVQRSWGLLEWNSLTTKSTEAKKQRYGPMVYEEFMRQKSTFSSVLLTLTLLVGFSLMTLSPVRWFVGRLGMKETSIDLDRQLESGSLDVINVTTSLPSSAFPKPVKVETTISAKGDPGYYLSPIMMAESGLALLLDKPTLPALAKNGGVLTPAIALGDVIVKRLQEFAKFDIRCEVVDGAGESRKTI
ncbi:Saccharopine dehydrogenase-domain-containing protein [Lentinula edodes]|uniref:NAD-P-binding protein n=1 Tax=Lentinula edodes TaxID=5353 RepID=UPI001E8D6F98|nr:NAD-P-binding protein [Lentinula edodes]KAH7880803.1 NAD-P-binding protein [Lentinula edodes]KAJ3909483.1 Saccharopine dehydrogenase-domain-containing protein [Lentinula edodes]